MADLIRLANVDSIIHKEKLASPTGSDDGNLAGLETGLGGVVGGFNAMMAAAGGIDLGDLAQELDQDEFDGPNLINGEC